MLTIDQVDEIANGDPEATAFLLAFQDRAHVVDDIADHDDVDEKRLVSSEVDWLMTLAGNEFFLRHKAALVPMIVCGINAWHDSNHWRRSADAGKRKASDVLKGFYHEVAYLVAFLTGGLGHMQQMSAKYRAYDYEEAN